MRVVDEMMALVKTYSDVTRYRVLIYMYMAVYVRRRMRVCNNNKGTNKDAFV